HLVRDVVSDALVVQKLAVGRRQCINLVFNIMLKALAHSRPELHGGTVLGIDQRGTIIPGAMVVVLTRVAGVFVMLRLNSHTSLWFDRLVIRLLVGIIESVLLGATTIRIGRDHGGVIAGWI